jgi:hypothetical protein
MRPPHSPNFIIARDFIVISTNRGLSSMRDKSIPSTSFETLRQNLFHRQPIILKIIVDNRQRRHDGIFSIHVSLPVVDSRECITRPLLDYKYYYNDTLEIYNSANCLRLIIEEESCHLVAQQLLPQVLPMI